MGPNKIVLGVVLSLAAVLILVAGSQQIMAELDTNVENDCNCPETTVSFADPTEVHTLVQVCTEKYPGYIEGWMNCIIDNPTNWMFDNMVLTDIDGMCIPIVKLHETPAERIGELQLQFKQVTDFNNEEFIDIVIEPEHRENLYETLKKTNKGICKKVENHGEITVCSQNCPDPKDSCKPKNNCWCLRS